MCYPHCTQQRKGWIAARNGCQFPKGFWVRKELLRSEQGEVSHAVLFLSILNNNNETSNPGRCSDVLKLIPAIIVRKCDCQFMTNLYCNASCLGSLFLPTFRFLFLSFICCACDSITSTQFSVTLLAGTNWLFVLLFSILSVCFPWAAAFASLFF